MIKQKIHLRYSEAFKHQVISELETRKINQAQAKLRYGITGGDTINRWLKKYGKLSLIPKTIIVQTPNEKDLIKSLKEEIKKLKTALADTQIDYLIERAQFDLLCEDLKLDKEEMKKKVKKKLSGK